MLNLLFQVGGLEACVHQSVRFYTIQNLSKKTYFYLKKSIPTMLIIGPYLHIAPLYRYRSF